MKHRILARLMLAIALAILAFAPSIAQAQSAVTKQPNFAGPIGGATVWVDLGNGPTEILPIEGNGQAFTSSGSGIGSTSGSSTTLTLTGTPAVAPCVGCQLTGTGITPGTTVAAFNGTTTITMSAAMTVAASTPLTWGAACPTAGSAAGVASLSPPANLRGGTDSFRAAVPLNTGGRICVTGGGQSGLTFVNFTIGAW